MTKKKLNYTIIGFLVLIIILLIIDILYCNWICKVFNLEFSDSKFNNISTPIIGLVSIIIYYLALQITIRQNREINCYQRREIFLKDIQRLKDEALNIKVELVGIYSTDILNFEKVISNIYKELWENTEFCSDSINLESMQLNDFRNKSYYPQMLFLDNICLSHSLQNGYYDRVKRLIEKIIISDLTEKHIKLIIDDIEIELLKDYLLLISNIRSMISISRINGSPYLVVRLNIETMKYEWISMEKTEIVEFYNWYANKIH